MYAIATRTRRALMLLAAALFLGIGGSSVHAQDGDDSTEDVKKKPVPRTDVVYLFDVSGSMRKQRALIRARELLVGIADKLVQPGTNVALIPFGTGVHKPVKFEVPADREGALAKMEDIRKAIGGVRARDSYTYLYQAIQKGLETLAEFKERNPGHARHIILVSDGKQLMRRGDKGPSLREIVEYIEGKGFKRGEDWFIWYGHFGAPDETLKNALEELGAGKTIPLDKLPTLHWAFTTLETNKLTLGRQKIGAWETTATIVATTDENGVGKKLTVNVAPGTLPEGMTLEIEPKEVELTATRTEFQVKLKCKGSPSGQVDGPVLTVDSKEDSLHWVENNRVEVTFFAGQPRIDVGTPMLKVGRLAPGMSATRTVTLIPNEDAAAINPKVKLAPTGSSARHIAVAKGGVAAGKRTEIPVKIAIPANARPGSYTCKVKVDAGGTVEVVPAEITVEYSVGVGHVTVGEDEITFDKILAGREANATITLTPDAETARIGTEIKVHVHLFAGRDVELVVPETVRLDGRTRVPVKVKVPLKAVGGRYEARIRFEAPEGIKIEPDAVPVAFRVVEASALSLPVTVDLGDVSASKAREVKGTLELVVGEPHAGIDLELVAKKDGATVEPRVISLKQGKMQIPVTVRTTNVKAGEHVAGFQCFTTRDGERKKVGEMRFRWQVRESFVKVESWASPAAVANGDGAASGTLVVNASEDYKGKTLRIAAAFGGLASGMNVGLGTKEVALVGGMQTIPVKMDVAGARTGSYDGVLNVGVGDKTLKALKVKLEVVGATVHLGYEGGFEGLEASADRVVMLALTASGVPAPAEFKVTLDRAGLPAEMDVVVPATVTIKTKDGVTRVPVRLKTGDKPQVGTWQPKITVKATKGGIAVTPESVTIRASVPEAVTVVKVKETQVDKSGLWIWLGVAVVVLFAVALFVLSRRKQIVHVHAPAEEKPAAVAEEPMPDFEDDDIVLEEDDMLVLEGLDDDVID